MKFHLQVLGALLVASTCACQAASYISDFSSASLGDPLVPIATFPGTGVDGWTQSEVNNTDAFPKAWIAEVGPSSTKGVVIGAYYDSYSSNSFHVNRALSTAFADTQLSMTIGVNDSSNSYPYRNDFSISLLNGSEANLIAIDFKASTQTFPPLTPDDNKWNIWVNGALTPYAILAGGGYNLAMNLVANGFDVDWTLTLDSTQVGTGTVLNASAETIGNLRIGTTQANGADWGDNVFGATNIVIPEPSTTLLMGMGALALLRRHRSG